MTQEPPDPWRRGLGPGGFIRDVDRFDADFFGIPESEANRLDPQQRVLLEVAWEAVDDGGLDADALRGSRAGVFVGISSQDYFRLYDRSRINGHELLGNASAIAANRISYFFDLRGPSLSVDTTCSSSLVAADLACRSLDAGECELALVGGVNVIVIPDGSMCTAVAGMNSADGRCKVFDAHADGMVRGEGAGVVVLKRLSRAVQDGDRIYATIRGSAVNHDGFTNGLGAPSPRSQSELLRTAYGCADVQPCEVDYVEVHAIGTTLGDAVEARALGGVVSEKRAHADPCVVGSVKSNIGHLEAASGMAALIKVALCFANEELPPCANLSKLNPEIPFEELGLEVARCATGWPRPGRAGIAGVSAFGLGGCNAHLVLQEPPETAPRATDPSEGMEVLPISARSQESLIRLAREYREKLRRNEGRLVDLCYTARRRRTHHFRRASAVGATREELAGDLDGFLAMASPSSHARPKRPRTALVFSGFGDDWSGAGRELYRRNAAFRGTVDECGEWLAAHGLPRPLEPMTCASSETCPEGSVQARALSLATQLGIAAVWRSWGVTPRAVVGTGLGEVAAAYTVGAVGLEEALELLCGSRRRRKPGGMAGIPELLGEIPVKEPAIPWWTTCSRGDANDMEGAAAPARDRVVRVASTNEALDSLVKKGFNVFLEIGPDASAAARLSDFLSNGYGATTPTVVSSLHDAGEEERSMYETLGRLYEAGFSVDWSRSHPHRARHVDLPAYPWNRKRFWYEYASGERGE